MSTTDYSPQTPMEHEKDQDSLVSHLSSYPLISMASSQLASLYSTGKTYSPLVHRVVSAVEHSLLYTARIAQPHLQNACGEKVNTVNEYALSGLEYIEERAPVVKMTPSQMRESLVHRWNESYAKSAVDTVAAAPAYARVTVENIHASASRTLDYADSLLDKYQFLESTTADVVYYKEHPASPLRVWQLCERVLYTARVAFNTRAQHTYDTVTRVTHSTRVKVNSVDAYVRSYLGWVFSTVDSYTTAIRSYSARYINKSDSLKQDDSGLSDSRKLLEKHGY